MAKERISATVDEETTRILEKILREGKYRNKSHLIETAIENFAKEWKENEGK